MVSNQNAVGEMAIFNLYYKALYAKISREWQVIRLRLLLVINRKSHIVDLL